MAELYIDAKGAVTGRLAAFVAKQALLGHKVHVLNSEEAVMSGRTSMNVEKYHYRIRELGQPSKGPFTSRLPDRFLRRLIRGMLDYKNPRGADAYKRIMCYIGVPEQFKDKKLTSVAKDASKLPTLKMQTVGQLCRALGGKV